MKYFPLLYLLGILVLAIVSWIGSVYGLDVHNLLSGEGLRWCVSNVLANFRHAPLAEILLALLALGILTESGFCRTLIDFLHPHHSLRDISLKRQRAFQLSLLAVILCIALTLSLTFFNNSLLLSAFGTFVGSALQHGLFPLLLLLLMVVGVVFGTTSGRFLTAADLIHAAGWLLSRVADYFLTLFLAAQLVGCLTFVLPTPAGHAAPMMLVSAILYLVPLILYLRRAF